MYQITKAITLALLLTLIPTITLAQSEPDCSEANLAKAKKERNFTLLKACTPEEQARQKKMADARKAEAEATAQVAKLEKKKVAASSKRKAETEASTKAEAEPKPVPSAKEQIEEELKRKKEAEEEAAARAKLEKLRQERERVEAANEAARLAAAKRKAEADELKLLRQDKEKWSTRLAELEAAKRKAEAATKKRIAKAVGKVEDEWAKAKKEAGEYINLDKVVEEFSFKEKGWNFEREGWTYTLRFLACVIHPIITILLIFWVWWRRPHRFVEPPTS